MFNIVIAVEHLGVGLPQGVKTPDVAQAFDFIAAADFLGAENTEINIDFLKDFNRGSGYFLQPVVKRRRAADIQA